MIITKEFLQNEIKSLKLQREQALANANAALGAIQGYEALIVRIEELDSNTSDVEFKIKKEKKK